MATKVILFRETFLFLILGSDPKKWFRGFKAFDRADTEQITNFVFYFQEKIKLR